MKKKFLLFSMVVVIIATMSTALLTGCTPREEVLKVYNWAEYIDADLEKTKFKEFKAYYKEVTGKNIKVKYRTFELNETMLNKIYNGADYDVICPSDYVLEKLRKADKLVKLSETLPNDAQDYRKNASQLFYGQEYDPKMEYSVPYTYGTLGILYNKSKLKAEHQVDNNKNGHPDFIENWSAMWSTDYTDQVFMKDSIRDTYAVGSIYTYREELANGTKTIEDVLNDTSQETINKVEQNLIWQKKNVLAGYEIDSGKEDLAMGKYTMSLQWSGDAVYSIDKAKNRKGGAVELGFYVPNEGSNLFFDCWAIPTTSKNPDAAQMFLNFMCRPDIAIRNMEEIGYTTAIASKEILEWCQNNESYKDMPELDLSMFFTDLGDVAKKVKADPNQFPPTAVLDRCAVMLDYGNRNDAVVKMWSNLKVAN